MSWEVRRAGDRFVTRSEGRTTWHSFSFGAHYDPANVGMGALLAHNDERLPPGTGYVEHRHRDVEIVTVVLEGALRHTSEVGDAVLGPGDVQRLSAGAGVTHREWSAPHAADQPGSTTRFVQTWLRPRVGGGPPSYAVLPSALPDDGLAPVETGADTGAELLAGGLEAGRTVALPETTGQRHVFVASGAVRLVGADQRTELGAEDAVRLDGAAVAIEPTVRSVLLVWNTASD